MFDNTKHQTILVKILKDIYTDPNLRTTLGFKGGTAAFLFHNLPRFSVDLDFDLLQGNQKESVFKKIAEILQQYGFLREAAEKRHTLFFLLNYGREERNVKVEVSKRPSSASYETKSYLGIPVLVMKKEDMAAGKLSAFLTRKKFASRDLFDLWFFLKNDWQINQEVLREKSDLDLKQALDKAVKKLTKVPQNRLLEGLGEILDEKQKLFVKEKLKTELVFYLKLYYTAASENHGLLVRG